MGALRLVGGPPVAGDPLVARLDQMLVELGAAVVDDGEATDGDRVDRIARLE